MTIPRWVIWLIALFWNAISFAMLFEYVSDVEGFANFGTGVTVLLGGIGGFYALLICMFESIPDEEDK